MKKSIKVILRVVCVTICIVIALQIKIISLGNGEKTIVYITPWGYKPGASAGIDLRNQLRPLYGENGIQTERLHCKWQGENATVYDTSSYETKYLGCSIIGGNYLSCKVITVRTVILDDNGEEAIPPTEQTSVYIAYDDTDLNSGERAKILWETLKEDYSDSKGYFNSLILEDKGQ